MEEMKMSGMVERVARAIEAADEMLLLPNGLRSEELHLFARAALKAIHEPTQAMVFAGMYSAQRVGGAISSTEIEEVLRAMIDAALSEPQP